MEMDFALILFVLLVLTGVIWVADFFWLKKKRPKGSRNPWWVEYGSSFFPVILAVFLLRSFVVEPFKIPSGSMIPTLHVGDFILVNKFDYGIRLPILHTRVIDIGEPQRGDVMVFRYPLNPSLDYIKRVVGLPGDTVAYENKRLTINGKLVPEQRISDYLGADHLYYTPRYVETLGHVKHQILIEPNAPPYVTPMTDFPYRKQCHYNSVGVTCKVPPGHYFVMGDNRDNSEDSRYWGFVPEKNIVGKAFFIWFNFSDLKRIGPLKGA